MDNMKILPNRTESLFGNIPYICQKRVMRWDRRKNYSDSKFLIIDDKDGHIGLCPMRKNIPIVVFETNKVFIDGGKMDIPVNVPNTNDYVFINRTILGFKDRIKNELLDSSVEIINRNYYGVDHFKEYDYVIASRSLDRKENEIYDMDFKINKLKSNVKKNGYLYIEYLISLDEDNEDLYPSNVYLKKDQIENYFPKDEWTVLSNSIELTKDLLSPLNNTEKNIMIGKLDVVRKATNVKRRRTKQHYTSYDSKVQSQVKHKYIINGVIR